MPVRKRLIARNPKWTDPNAGHPLDRYRAATGAHLARLSPVNRPEIEIETYPGDQVAQVSVLVDDVATEGRSEIELLRIHSTETDNPVEITDLKISDNDRRILTRRDGSDMTIVALTGPSETIIRGRVAFRLWDCMGPKQGYPPYTHSTIRLSLQLTCARQSPTLVLLSTPESSSPRGTQGTYAMASPSCVQNDRRLTRLYYPSGVIRLAYRFGTSQGLTAPWLSLGRASASSVFVFCVAYLASTVAISDRFLALIAAFIAVASLVWDFVQDSTQFSIYDARKSPIQFAVLLGQVAVLATMALAVVALTARPELNVLAARISAAVAATIAMAAMAGMYLHSIGWWHGFICDQEGCATPLRHRRDRAECHYTGRVLCSDHVASMCDNCAHGVDLRHAEANSRHLFGKVSTPCGAVLDTDRT